MADSDQMRAVVFDFEAVLPALDRLPIAARRALDHAGLRLSLPAWRSLPMEDRRRIISAGAEEAVDVARVASAVRRASPAAQAVEPVGDPDPLSPPAPLVSAHEPARWIDPATWARMRALDRYALTHEQRRAIARNDPARFIAAFETIVGARDAALPLPAPSAVPEPLYERTPPPYERTPPPYERTPPPYERTPPPYDSLGRYSSMPSPVPPRLPASPRTSSDPATGRRDFSPAPPQVAPPAPALPSKEISASRETPWASAMRRDSAAPRQSPSIPAPPVPTAIPQVAPEQDEATPVWSTHVLPSGEVHMVDVRPKAATNRRALAQGSLLMRPETAQRVLRRDAPKGEVLATSRVAGIMAAKRTAELIPLCHSVSLTRVTVDIDVDPAGRATVTAIAEAYDRTGVEMEAMVAVSVTCLALYDMLKGVDREMIIEEVKLLEKTGGRSGDFKRGPSARR